MNNIKDFISNLKSSGVKLSRKNIVLISLCIIGAALLVISELVPSEDESKTVSSSTSSAASDEYINETEEKLETMLSSIDGAGETQVMITLDSFYENVYAKGYTTKEQSADGESEEEMTENYITVKTGSSSEECLLVKVYEPEIRGVAVCAEGAGSAEIRKAITDTVTAVFGISSTKVSVEKMKYIQEEK